MGPGAPEPQLQPTRGGEIGMGLDTAQLAAFLSERLGLSGPMSIERISGGQSNSTCFVTILDRRFVVRKRPFGPTSPSAHAIDREDRIMAALADTGVPVTA